MSNRQHIRQVQEIMDQMDVDHVPDVPDTPDRLSAQNNNGKSSLDTGSNKFISGRLGNRNLFEGVHKTQFKVNDNGSGKFLMCVPKKSVTSSVSDHRGSSDFASGKPSSSNNSSVLPRRVPDEIPNHEHKHFHPTKNYKSVYAQSSARQDGSVVDLTERNGHVGAWKNVFPSGASGSSRAEEYGKRTLSANRLASSNSMASSSTTARFANKGKEAYNTGSGSDCGNVDDCANDTQPKAGRVVSTSNSSAIVPRVTGQKRLVRNGCISPHNIAKTKQSVAEDKNGSDVGVNHALPESSSSPQIASDSHTSKGKGVMNLPSSMKEPGARSTHPPSRNAINIKEIVGDSVTDELRSFQELGGWRSTRNRSKQNIFPFSRQNQGLPQEEGDTCLTNGLPSSIVENGEIRSAAGTSHSNPMDIDATSILDASLPPRGQRASHFRAQLGRFNKHRPAAITLTKRQKQGFTSSTRGECSRAAMDNADILFLGSSENTGKSRTVETVSRNSLGSLDPVIEIDETSPEARGDRSSNGGSSSNDASAMARQIEADEMLARELQEQFYSEVPTVGVGEIDVHAALALQNGEDLSHVFSRRSRAYHARSSSTSNSSRQSQSSSPLSLLRRGSEARAPTLNRMARLRNRFPGQPRTLSSSRERNSLFPVDMDVDMRMYILEALEAISDMGVDNGLLHTQRDFNESDYEMLLALDENNHQHGGASTAQINGLPQSTVQSDNLEEACAICLETPTMGDTIRHLPCLHKFHKDCIDPWLRRKTSCPVCKSSTT